MQPLLKQLWGTLQVGARLRASTAQIWSDLRISAAGVANRIRGVPGPALPADLEAQGANVLRAQGVGVQQVNQGRRLAGQWLRARNHLQGVGEDEQITSGSIFQPPWAQTGVGGVRPEFLARAHLQVTAPDGSQFDVWRPYGAGTTLTTKGDLLDFIRSQFPVQGDSDIPPGSTLTDITDLTLEVL